MTRPGEISLRTLDMKTVGERPEATWCKVPGCPNNTSNHKPYCFAHLDRLAYVRRLREELDASSERVICMQRPLKKAI